MHSSMQTAVDNKKLFEQFSNIVLRSQISDTEAKKLLVNFGKALRFHIEERNAHVSSKEG